MSHIDDGHPASDFTPGNLLDDFDTPRPAKPPASLVSPAGEEPTPPTAPTPTLGSPRSSVGDGEASTVHQRDLSDAQPGEAPAHTASHGREDGRTITGIITDVGVPAGSPEGEPRPELSAWEKLRATKPAIPYLLYFPSMREVARRHGYALGIHGSLARDFDLIAVAWTPEASTPDVLVEAIAADNKLFITVPDKGDKPHGRRCWTLQNVAGVTHGWIDLAVIGPRSTPVRDEPPVELQRLRYAMELLEDACPRDVANAQVRAAERFPAAPSEGTTAPTANEDTARLDAIFAHAKLFGRVTIEHENGWTFVTTAHPATGSGYGTSRPDPRMAVDDALVSAMSNLRARSPHPGSPETPNA